ncbi:hypothetical protein GGI15_003302 [Coemansia interrupta]|uniref:Glucose-6-phosphate 1-epimerase n=1 Tax=Coemansia interrupta TaxID=1126814 RepID=A0A9W8H841_9FUNG|nr:hypothetical protein GGI15_003302 [Coemansia interrupta]
MTVQEFNDAAGNLERVVLSGPESASVEIYVYGATVTSWKSASGSERLFVSRQAVLDGSKPIRGGIPLVFPQFGPGILPQHGFARNQRWAFLGATEHGAGVAATFELRDTPETRASAWPFRFVLTYTVDLTAHTLSTIVKCENADERAFEFTALMHTYFGVGDIGRVVVEGLEGVAYDDKVSGEVGVREARGEVGVAANEDRVYRDVQGNVVVRERGGASVEVRRFNFKDVVLWNPWEQKAREMGDFADDEYHRMVCVEAGTVASSIALKPGQTISCGQLLTAQDAAI